MHNFDLLSNEGHFINPAQELNSKADIAIKKGDVVKVDKTCHLNNAKQIIKVSQYIISASLVDLHTHVYSGVTSIRIHAEDYCHKSTVTIAMILVPQHPETLQALKIALSKNQR